MIAISIIISLHLPGAIGSLLFALNIFLCVMTGWNDKAHTNLRIEKIFAPIILLILVAHYLINLSNAFQPPELIAVIHGSVYLFLLASLRGRARLNVPEKTIAAITLVNLLLLLIGSLGILTEISFVEKANGIRFKSYFGEPAKAAIVYCIHILLMSESRSMRLKYFVYASSALLVLFTFSGAGLILLFIALMQWQTGRWLVPVGLGVLAGVLLLGIALPSQLDSIVLSRAERIFSNDLSNSSFLRFVAPFMVVEDAFQAPRTLIAGIGIGSINEYILANWSLFHYLRDFSGSRVFEINNGYVVILISLGLPMGLSVLVYLGARLLSAHETARKKLFFILLPFLTGVVWSSSFWLPFYMAAGIISFSNSRPGRHPLPRHASSTGGQKSRLSGRRAPAH